MMFAMNISFGQTTFFVITTDSVTNVTATSATLSLTGSSTDSVHTGWKMGVLGQFFQFVGFIPTESMLPSVTRTVTLNNLFTGVPYTVQAYMVRKDTAGMFIDTVDIGGVVSFTPNASQVFSTITHAVPAYTVAGNTVTATCNTTNASILRLKVGITFPLQTIQTIAPVTDGANTATFSLTSFVGSSIVNYQWVAYSASGDSVLTSPQSVTVPTSLPGITFATPVLDSVFANGAVITAAWSGTLGVPKIVSYHVYTDLSFTTAVWGNTPPVSTASSMSTTFTMTNLSPNTTYYFKCDGSDSLGVDMALLSFTTSPSPPVSVDPTVSFQIIGATQTQLSLSTSWTRGSSASVDVIVDYSTSALFIPVSSMLLTSDTSSAGSYITSISGLLPGTLYYMRVRVVGSTGLMVTSSIESSTTLSGGGTCVPQIPQVQNFAPVNPSTIAVTLQGSVTTNADSVLVIAEFTEDSTFSNLVGFPDMGTWYSNGNGCVTVNIAITKTFSSGIMFGTYYARFLVVDMYNAPVYSNIITITINNLIEPTVSALAVDSTNHNSVHINFVTDGDGLNTQYVVRYSYGGIQDSLGWAACPGTVAIQSLWINGLPSATPIFIEVEIAGGNVLNLNTSTTAAPFVPFAPTVTLFPITGATISNVPIMGNVTSNASTIFVQAEVSTNTSFSVIVASADTTFVGSAGTVNSFSFYKTVSVFTPGTYYVRLTALDNSNVAVYSIVVSVAVIDPTASVHELEPATMYFGAVNIFSLTGTLLYQSNAEEFSLQILNEKIAGQSSGVYVYYVRTKDGYQKRGKFIH